MRQNRLSTPSSAVARPRGANKGTAHDRVLRIAVVLSVAAHAVVGVLLLVLPRVLPHDAPPREQGTVELLMVEQKGGEPHLSASPKDADPAPPRPAQPAAKAATAASSIAAAPVPHTGGEPIQQPSAKPQAGQAANQMAMQPSPARSQQAPVFDLAGTESESNAIALGPSIVPAMPDNRFRNRPPAYPADAELHGETGSVVLLIHVSATGLAAGVDVTESSGVSSLDQAAIAAVRRWHFHPALKAGRAVPFDMPFRFIFQGN